jgi:hypothetical protein
VSDARAVEAYLDQTTPDVNVRPSPGRLFALGGRASVPAGYPQGATLTLVSDMGSQTTNSDPVSGAFQFNPVAPGDYELYAEAPGDRFGRLASFQQLKIEKDKTDVSIGLLLLPIVSFAFTDTKGETVDSRAFQVLARRKELQGDGKPQTLRLTNNTVQLSPGRWDLALAPMDTRYVAQFRGPAPEGLMRGPADGWNEVLLVASSQRVTGVRFELSPAPGAIHGTVMSGRDRVPGVPVYLEAYDLENRRRLTDVRTVRTDMRGQYGFYGLAPGTYRILSTFEFQTPDTATMDAAEARTVAVEEKRDLALDLDLYVIR